MTSTNQSDYAIDMAVRDRDNYKMLYEGAQADLQRLSLIDAAASERALQDALGRVAQLEEKLRWHRNQDPQIKQLKQECRQWSSLAYELQHLLELEREEQEATASRRLSREIIRKGFELLGDKRYSYSEEYDENEGYMYEERGDDE